MSDDSDLESVITITRKSFNAAEISKNLQLAKLGSDDGCDLIVSADNDELDSSDIEEDHLRYIEETRDGLLMDSGEQAKRDFLALYLNGDRDHPKSGSAYDQSDLPEYLYDKREEPNLYLKTFAIPGTYEKYLADNVAEFEEICPGQVYKSIDKAGYGIKVEQDSFVMYNCALFCESSKDPFDSSWLRNKVITCDLATDSILPGINELLLTMTTGEWCKAFIKPKYAFGKLGVEPRIPGDATIFAQIEVVKVVPPDDMDRLCKKAASNDNAGLNFEDYYEASNKARMRGNYFFNEGKYNTALQRYRAGTRMLESLTFKDECEQKKAEALLLKLYSNIARAANGIGAPWLALGACREASALKPNEPSVMWNRMIAWKKKHEFDRAITVCKKALKYCTLDAQGLKAFQDEMRVIENLKEREQKDTNDLYRLMGEKLVH